MSHEYRCLISRQSCNVRGELDGNDIRFACSTHMCAFSISLELLESVKKHTARHATAGGKQ